MTSPNLSNILFVICINFVLFECSNIFSNIQTEDYNENTDSPSEDIFSDVIAHSDYHGALNDEIFHHFDNKTQESDDM